MSILRWKRQAKPITGLFVSLFFYSWLKNAELFWLDFFSTARFSAA
jgi:hypothetical protein